MSQSPENYWLNPPSIIVDDSDPTIEYNGTWHTAKDTDIEIGLFDRRTPYFNTLHVLQIFSGSLSYSFTGAGISVFGAPYNNSTYTSQCFLDGHQLSFGPNATKAEFGQSRPVCQAFGLPDNMVHTISVSVSVPPRQQEDLTGPLSGFAFDYLLIQPPSPTSPWDNRSQDALMPVLDTLFIETQAHPTFDFGIILELGASRIANVSREWKFDPENGFYTTTPGSQFSVTFIGTSLWWYGYTYAFDLSGVSLLQPSAATFSIDNGTPSTVIVGALGVKSSQALLFKTPVLQYATHVLTVVHHGFNATMPLTLQSLVVQKSTPTPTLPSSTVGVFPTTTMSKLPSRRRYVAGIAGGIAGGVIFLLLLASGLCLLARWSRRRHKYMQTEAARTTAVQEPFPVPTEENVCVTLPRKVQPGQQNVGNPLMERVVRQAPPLSKWSRHHTMLASHEPIPTSAAVMMQQQALPELRINHPIAQSDSRTHTMNTDLVDGPPAVQVGDASHPTAPDITISTTLPAIQGEREEDSGLRILFAPVLPPIYTTY